MSKKRSFFERLTGGITLSGEDERIDDVEEVESENKKNTKKSAMAKLTPLNSENKNKGKKNHNNKDSDEEDESDEVDEKDESEDVANLSVDVFESHTEIIVNAFVAGVTPENIDITITRNSISIRGSREDEAHKGFEQIENELFWGKFERDVMLNVDLEPDRAEASQKQGLLTITVPKIDRDRRSTPKVKSV